MNAKRDPRAGMWSNAYCPTGIPTSAPGSPYFTSRKLLSAKDPRLRWPRHRGVPRAEPGAAVFSERKTTYAPLGAKRTGSSLKVRSEDGRERVIEP